jgi:hypothetical protein
MIANHGGSACRNKIVTSYARNQTDRGQVGSHNSFQVCAPHNLRFSNKVLPTKASTIPKGYTLGNTLLTHGLLGNTQTNTQTIVYGCV